MSASRRFVVCTLALFFMGFEAVLAQSPPPTQQTAPSVATASAPGPYEDSASLAKKVANPLANLTSLPFLSDFDYGMGPNHDGVRYTLNFQPAFPIPLNRDWNLLSRTVAPIVRQSDVLGATTQFGLGDTTQSFFLSPTRSRRVVWGIGPALLLPTATDDVLGSGKFGIGPTLVVLKQHKAWTIGALTNHLWSVAGSDTRPGVSSTFLQPFLKYTTKSAWTFALSTETTYDWTAGRANVPIHLSATKLARLGKQPVSMGGGLRCWAASFPGGPHGCGLRLIMVPVFPKKRPAAGAKLPSRP